MQTTEVTIAPPHDAILASCSRRTRWLVSLLILLSLCMGSGCSTIRVTDPNRTATEEFLVTGAAAEAVRQLSTDALRDRIVWVDTTYLTPMTPGAPAAPPPPLEDLFMVAELRAKLL